VPTITLVSFAGRGGAGDDLALRGTVHALGELSPDAALTAVVAVPGRVGAFLDPSVRLVEGPLRTLAGIEASAHVALRGRRTVHTAERLLEDAMAGRASVPEPVRAALEAVGGSDLVLFVGGGYLSDRRPLRLMAAWMLGRAAAGRGVPYALFGHSVGPFEHGGWLAKARQLMEGAEQIGIREPRSVWEVAAMLRGRQADPMGDPALLLLRPEPQTEPAPVLLANFPGLRALTEYRRAPDQPALTLADGLHMAARQLRADVRFVQAGSPPAADDRAGNAVLDAGLLPSLTRGRPLEYAPGRLELPGASVAISTDHDLCSWALGHGIPAVGVALTPHARHELRGLMDLFRRPDWVWVPEAVYGIHDLTSRAVSAANDPDRAQLRKIADQLAARQRAWLAAVVPP
jgi:hypothetical protein